MSIRTLNHAVVDKLGINLNSSSCCPPECFIVEYDGAVLDVYERNGYQDSDFFAIVWDEESQSVKDVEYATTRGWTYLNGANVDATDEVKAKAAAYWRARHRQSVKLGAKREADGIRVGVRARVVRGRKAPKGFEGTVRSVVERVDHYRSRYTERKDTFALIVADDGSSWEVKAEYCESLASVEERQAHIERALAAFDAQKYNPKDFSWRSAPYQEFYYAGVNPSRLS